MPGRGKPLPYGAVSHTPHAHASKPEVLRSARVPGRGKPLPYGAVSHTPHAHAAQPEALNPIASWVQRHAATFETRKCIFGAKGMAQRNGLCYTANVANPGSKPPALLQEGGNSSG